MPLECKDKLTFSIFFKKIYLNQLFIDLNKKQIVFSFIYCCTIFVLLVLLLDTFSPGDFAVTALLIEFDNLLFLLEFLFSLISEFIKAIIAKT